ncbi:DNA ligase D [Prosthecomicrobium sp. N25]|uniref:DNA ligase D n=1 Tax=Prosthecomicrobium sp. N25 TaxID=3129254 RepID=UPI003076A08E
MADLDTYRAKRDFAKTPEPSGEAAAAGAGDSFVIQKHAATRLHYDFRLELDGVLKSWAVTRGPSLVPGEKRLAVETEDHPLDYGGFEGTIPKGQYGGGTVILWDRGRWRPLFDPHKGLAKGHLEFELEGERLHGRWHLVRMKGRRGEKRTNWLLIKGEDEHARAEGDPEIVEEALTSVESGRTIEDVTHGVGEVAVWQSKPVERSGARRKARITKAADAAAPDRPEAGPGEPIPAVADPAAIPKSKAGRLPDFVEPCLATLQPKPPSGAAWLHEIKFDGYRLQARIKDGRVALRTRSGLDWTSKFGARVPEALARLPVRTALLDGELVVEGPNGASDFSALQADLGAERSDRFVYYAFDLLHLDGRDLTGSPLGARKATLEQVMAGVEPLGPIRYSAHFEVSGDAMLRHACRLSLEGVVSKRADRPYRGGRGKDWVKSKCADRQEFVVAGYVPSTVNAKAIGSLVLGYHDASGLRHAGRVGTGFTNAVATELKRRLDRLRAARPTFAAKLPAAEARGVTWVRPELVAEVEFRGWTAAESLRHASFRGLRDDKAAADVVREGKQGAETASEAPAVMSAARTSVKLTHPDRVYWPETGVTKAGLADYYAEVWRLIAPHVVGRPLSLVRCPGGTAEACFFQKHAWKGIHRAIQRHPDPLDEAGEDILWIRDFDGLVALVQAGVLEIHPWGSALADLERPDRIVMDLDPHEDVPWSAMIAAAEELRERMRAAGLVPFLKNTGGKGLHVCAPLKPAADWETVKGFCRDLAEAMERDAPARFVSTATKAKRTGRIFVDYLRNGRGATVVAPYSTRARTGATVSTPLAWDELGPEIGPAHYTVLNLGQRLAGLPGDPWADFGASAVPLEAAKPARKRAKR